MNRWAVWLLALGLGCGPARAPSPTAAPPQTTGGPRLLTASDALPTGPAATAAPGDWLLTAGDGRVRFVVGGKGHREGFQASGGNLLDLSLDGKDDQLDGVSTWFEREFPRQGDYQQFAVDGPALVVRGLDSANPEVQVETRWEPAPSPDGVIGSLRCTTTVTSAVDLPAYDLGDLVGWGGLRHFAPGLGFALKGTDQELPWIGAEAEDHAVLLVGDGPVGGPHGASWSDPVWGSPDLAANTPHTYVRTLHVGETLAELLGAVGATHVVRVAAQETGTDRAIPSARFRVDQGGAPYLVGRTNPRGFLDMRLPAGEYSIELIQRGRRSPGASPIPSGARAVVVRASPEGRVAARIQGPDGPVAGRLTWFGVTGTPDPDLGSPSHAIGGNRANLSQPGTVLVPPGEYRVVATRGPTWSRAEALVTVPDGPLDLTMSLRPLVPTDGFLQCDLHQHAVYSSDSAIPAVDGVIASAAEGLDCIATTEHDAVADWTEHIADAALSAPMLWLSGIEVTSNKEGHYNVYPYPPQLGVIEHAGLDPYGITAAIRARAPDAVLQVNHPRYGAIGVFNRLGTEERIAQLDVDAIEVLNGKDVVGARRILDDVARLLGAGLHPALVGASDSHHLVGQERGSARTFVAVDGVAGDGVAVAETARDAIRARRTTASNGPLLTIDQGEGEVRVSVSAPAWMRVQTVALFSGPFGGGGSAGLGEAVAVWELDEEPRDEVASGRWTHAVPKGEPRWFLAVAQGSEPMDPWLDTTPWAVTSPVIVR